MEELPLTVQVPIDQIAIAVRLQEQILRIERRTKIQAAVGITAITAAVRNAAKLSNNAAIALAVVQTETPVLIAVIEPTALPAEADQVAAMHVLAALAIADLTALLALIEAVVLRQDLHALREALVPAALQDHQLEVAAEVALQVPVVLQAQVALQALAVQDADVN